MNINSTKPTKQSIATDEAALVALELLINDMEDNEKSALAIQAVWSYDSTFSRQLLSIQPKSELHETLQKAIGSLEDLSPGPRVALAINLLEQLEQEGYEKEADEDEDEDEEEDEDEDEDEEEDEDEDEDEDEEEDEDEDEEEDEDEDED